LYKPPFLLVKYTIQPPFHLKCGDGDCGTRWIGEIPYQIRVILQTGDPFLDGLYPMISVLYHHLFSYGFSLAHDTYSDVLFFSPIVVNLIIIILVSILYNHTTLMHSTHYSISSMLLLIDHICVVDMIQYYIHNVIQYTIILQDTTILLNEI
jgi:hypothetical protein